MRTFFHDELRTLARTVLEAVGTPSDLARVVGNSLVDANLAGHDSHGVLRLPGYCGSLRDGDVVPEARASVVHKDRATARVDGCWGWGQPAMQLATETTIELAREFGMGATVVQRCYHIGRAAPYVETVARAGMIGIAMSNGGPAVAPYGGRQRVLGTNPVAWALPRGDAEDPLSFDIATAGIAEGKLRVARANDRKIGPGLLVDAGGAPSQDPNDFFSGGAILPFGGHKGNGFSVLAQMLGRALAGMDTTGFDGPRGANGPIIIVLDIAPFTLLDHFTAEVDAQTELILNSAPADGFDEVIMPGDLEIRTRQDRLTNGIPIPDTTWKEVAELMAELGVQKGAGPIESA
jgi:LDH2 family malate/lactate/ureidoglycolate dehydrogenase